MVYMGSKAKYTKEIVPILQKIIDDNNITIYVEPFVGGANVIDKIRCDLRIGCDKSKTLIGLLKQAQDDFSRIPTDGSREWWDKAKAIYRGESNEYMEPYMIGAIQFFASFSNGGFPRGYAKNTSTRNYYKEAYRNLEIQAPKLKGIHFDCRPYQDTTAFRFDKPDILYYCDPPYQGTKEYGYSFEAKFDHEEYWNWIRKLSQDACIVCSEQVFPDDFNIIWEKKVKRTNGKDNTFKAVEKLGVYSQGVLSNFKIN